MSAIWTKRFVNFLLVIVALAAVGALVQAWSAYSEGKFHMVSYPAESDRYQVYPIGNWDAFWQAKEGSVRVDDHAWLRAARLAGELIAIGLLAAIFWQLRGFLGRVAGGDVFSDANILALRRIGKLLVSGSVLGISIAVMTQFAILEALPETLDGDRIILPSISFGSDPEMPNIRMQYTPPILPMLMAMIAFITAGAFKSGQQYREDSESVV
ncbi:DUF2975 domain-containing protein [Aurantiacibacter sediminis]|uniref:DUF2975 domain-containing protein n=1 Tax=Aurantiacibacter sediminis TaxID=2793064 RepID=A0ABS0N4F3_9SPHN|nr:DUF2975 domain-containing protein [Aurantiacibacter sediminis]MBH5322833.1 DUF2975 domain-containing protein [Aurantiacibacter sediminis]